MDLFLLERRLLKDNKRLGSPVPFTLFNLANN
jgi:hypothetical protein